MARPRKEGTKAPGIQSKNGFLYIVVGKTLIEDGKKKRKNIWITTGLRDTRENVNKAISMRSIILNRMNHAATLDTNIRFKEFIPIFLEDRKNRVADTTYAAYFYKARHILNYFENFKVREINEFHINEFLDSLFTKNNLNKRTVRDIKAVFTNLMEFAISRGIIADNPVKRAEINKKLAAEHTSGKKMSDTFFSYEEAIQFLNIAKDHELYYLFHTTLCFGLRKEEVLGIKWDALDLNNGILKIQHTVNRGTKINRRDAVKTDHSRREYPLSPEQIEMFKRIKDQENINRIKNSGGYEENDYVFKNEYGVPYSTDYPYREFKKLVHSCPTLPQDINFHGLRSSCVSILVHLGYDIKTIQEYVGHADHNTTLRKYAKVKEKDSKAEVLDTMISMLPVFSSIKDIKAATTTNDNN